MDDDTTGTTTGTTTDDTTTGPTADETTGTGTTNDDTDGTGTTGSRDDRSSSGEAPTTPTTGTGADNSGPTDEPGSTPGAGSAARAALAARLHMPLGDLLTGSLDDQLIAMEALTKAITSADPVTESDRYGASFLGQAALRTHVMTENLSGVKLDWMGLEQEAGTWDVSGRFRTYASYVATAYGTSATNARRMVNLAKGLRNHLPGTRARLRAGRIGVDQAQILLKVTSTDAGINALQNPSIPTTDVTSTDGTGADAGTSTDTGAGADGATEAGTETAGTDATDSTADTATGADATDATDGSGTGASTATDGGADGTADGADDPAGSATAGAGRVPTVEELLLENAAVRTPEELRQLVEHFLMMADPDATDKAFRDAAGREFLNIDRTMDGYHVAGFLTIEHGQYIRTALEAMMGVPAAGEERTLSQRRAQALADLTRVALDEGKVGKSNSVRPHLGVLISTPEFLDLINTAKTNTGTAAAATGTAAGTGAAPGSGTSTATGTSTAAGTAGGTGTGTGAAPVCTSEPVATGIVAGPASSAAPTDVDPAAARPQAGEPIVDPLPDLATLTPSAPDGDAASPATPAPSTNGAALPTGAGAGSAGATLPTGPDAGPDGAALSTRPVAGSNGAALPTGPDTGSNGAALASSSLLLPGTTPVAPVDPLDRDWATLLAAGPARFIDNTGPVPRAVLEKLINCTGEIYRIILGPDNEIINHGRAHRLFTTPQRRALVARDQHCVAPNCTAPPEWCESHHGTRHWADGGETNLEDAALLCSHDHDWVHNHHITMTRKDGTWHFYKPDGTEILPTPGPWD